MFQHSVIRSAAFQTVTTMNSSKEKLLESAFTGHFSVLKFFGRSKWMMITLYYYYYKKKIIKKKVFSYGEK